MSPVNTSVSPVNTCVPGQHSVSPVNTLTHPPVGSTPSEQLSALAADKLSLHDLFARLPIGQLWGFIGIVVGLFMAALGLGWAVRGVVEDTKVQAATAKADDL